MILQIESVGPNRLMNTIDNIKIMIARRARLSSLLDALTMGVFQNLHITATEIRVLMIPGLFLLDWKNGNWPKVNLCTLS